MIRKAKTMLKDIFGYDSFKLLQEDIIFNVLQKKDTLVIMPTGGGKSLCYQIPALMFNGLTIVISPLISLMKDQVEQLEALGIPAVVLNSSISYQQYNENINKIRLGQVKFLYLAPETLLKENVQSLLESVNISCLTVDEAHCISEWGHDFRPEYRQIRRVRTKYPDAVCIALTATATKRVQTDIEKNLGFDNANSFIASFDRNNLMLKIIPKESPVLQTLDYLKKHDGQAGIIYCFSRKQVDELSSILAQEGYAVRPYHAGLTEKQRRENQEMFIKDDIQIIVATIAFGMGINKSNVRFVIHYDLPKNIESYYQEIGRAGRDGLDASCLLLFSYADIQKIKYFIRQKTEEEQKTANFHLNALLNFAESFTCRRKPLLRYFGEEYEKENCGMCDNCLSSPVELIDITIEAQKFLSCVKRTYEFFGATHIIDVLRGSGNQKVIKNGHQNLSTYGIGREHSKKQWYFLFRQFINQGLLSQDEQHGSLKLTDKAYSVMKGEESIKGTLQEATIDKEKKQDAITNYDYELFELLRKKRKVLADDADLPPYIIFSDKTLIEMATYFPQTKASMLEINGVGQAKYDKYGREFLSIIKEYCQENNIEEQEHLHYTTRKLAKNTSNSKRHIEIGELFNRGHSVAELMREYNVKQNTILNHLLKYVQDGNSLLSKGLLPDLQLSQAEQERALQQFDKFGSTLLKPVFEALDEEISYDDLRVLQLKYFVESN